MDGLLVFLASGWKVAYYFFWFVVMLSIVVFIHEFGHFIVARYFGVRVEVFSIGFGRELIGWNDRYGTRWKIAWIPFGGYVKMFGDADPSSSPDFDALTSYTEEEKQQSFYFKDLYQKALVVFAGPAFNYLLAIAILGCMYTIYGKHQVSNEITAVEASSPAEAAGLKAGDVIIEADGRTIKSFDQMREVILTGVGDPIELRFIRGGKELEATVKPVMKEIKDPFGDKVTVPFIGVGATKPEHMKLNVATAFMEATYDSYRLSVSMLRTIGQMLTGARGLEQLGGPIKIAQYSGKTAEAGVVAFLWFTALISINLGLMNLMPVPMLDGGHLLYYLIHKVTGSPVRPKYQMLAIKMGFILLVSLMLYVTFNDFKGLLGR